MKWKSPSLVPVLICAGVTVIFCGLEWLGERDTFTPLQRLEWMTYDWRVKLAANNSPAIATNLGFVAIKDESIEALLDGSLPYRFGLQWPRQVYARLLDELNAQGARAVGFDVIFGELRPDHPPALVGGAALGSDEFFAREIRRAGHVILAAEKSVLPADLFRTNAWAVAEISAPREVDGILRRARAFTSVTVWHPALREAAREFGWKLAEAKIEKGRMIFPRDDSQPGNVLPLNDTQEFNASVLAAKLHPETATAPSPARWEKPFTEERLWQLGILLAARDLHLDLSRARIDLARGRVEIPDDHGSWRVIPVDREGRFYIDWSLTPQDQRLTKEGIEYLLMQYELRHAGRTNELDNRWAGKLVVVGSTATGGNLTDLGATPLEHETFLMSEHWNVANSVLMNRFIHPLGLAGRVFIIALLGTLAGLCTWKMPTLGAIAAVTAIAAAYVTLAVGVFHASRLWLPMVTPLAGSLLITHVSLVAYLARVERRERRRTKDIFSKIVSPEVVGELLASEKLSLGGERRCLTVFFADVRGFTEMTDMNQQRADALVATYKYSPDEARELIERQSEEILSTVNLYLGIAGDCIKKHGGTLDKYIGDCVMAFWGAPVPNPRHAVGCVHAVIDMQRAIFELNQQRREENARREEENMRRAFEGRPPVPLLDVLAMGSGINTGTVTVGLMGSDAHLVNYTVFGREVNLASRLEGASGRGRILIGEQTFLDLQRDDPELAASCKEQEPLSLKGFRDAVKAYEVPWRPPDQFVFDAGQTQTIIRDKNQREDIY